MAESSLQPANRGDSGSSTSRLFLNPQPKQDPRNRVVVDGPSRIHLRDSSEPSRVDGADDSTDIERVTGKCHYPRPLDEELAGEVKFGKWTPDTLLKLLGAMGRGYPYNHAFGRLTPTQVFDWLVGAEESTYFLGDNEGVVVLSPLIPGEAAEAHHYLWSPRFYRRPKLGRAVLRDACRRWSLRRITAQAPARHKALIKAIDRLGFTLEGRARNGIVDDKGVTDLLIYGILAEELED